MAGLVAGYTSWATPQPHDQVPMAQERHSPGDMAEASGLPGQFNCHCRAPGAVMVGPSSLPPFQAPHDGLWVEGWLGQPRFARYLAAAGSDRALALALYEWNAQISAAFQRDLAHLEIALRNAYDAAATSWGGTGHWLRDGYTTVFAPLYRTYGGHPVDVNQKNREQVAQAIRDAGGPAAPPGKVVPQLSFGFWRYLSDRAHERTLWIPFLHRAYVHGTSRAVIDDEIARLHALRNRIAHHEPLLRTDLAGRWGDILAVAAAISPDLAKYLGSSTATTLLLADRPVP